MSTPNPLPLYTVAPDAIIVSTDVASTDRIIAKLVEEAASNKFFGFDLEITSSKHVRLVQIASRERAYIFDIDLLGGFPPSLVTFLGSPEYVKLGVGVAGDARSLARPHKVELRGGGELSRLHRMFDMSGASLDLSFGSCVALDTLAIKWLGVRLDKSLQNGREWDGPLLSRHHMYAAADACVAFSIYDKMISAAIIKDARPSLWIFTEYDVFNSQCVGLRDDYAPHVAMSPRWIKAIEGALRKARDIFERANEERASEDHSTWTQQVMPDATILLDELRNAFSNYHDRVARGRVDYQGSIE